jgi:hypothetical protein
VGCNTCLAARRCDLGPGTGSAFGLIFVGASAASETISSKEVGPKYGPHVEADPLGVFQLPYFGVLVIDSPQRLSLGVVPGPAALGFHSDRNGSRPITGSLPGPAVR